MSERRVYEPYILRWPTGTRTLVCSDGTERELSEREKLALRVGFTSVHDLNEKYRQDKNERTENRDD